MRLLPHKCVFAIWAGVVILTGLLPLTSEGQTPRVDSFSPAFGEPGTQVTISGAFSPTATTTVAFGNGNILGDVSSVTAGQIVATVPTAAVTGPITVTHQFPLGTATHSSPQQFAVAPRINSFERQGSPGITIAAIGDTIQIEGANFVAPTGTIVSFNGQPASSVNVTASSQLFATVPAGATSGPLTVTTFAGTFVTSTNLVVSGSAVITGFTPTIGGGGTQVTISGGDFTTASAVTFNGHPALFGVTSASQVIATAPTNAGTGPIVITTSIGTATSISNFVGTGNAPVITNFTPASGKPGEPIVIEGFNFTGVTNVLFNGTNAAFGISADTQLTAFVPTNATSGFITLISQFGTNTSTEAFGIEPLITDFNPVAGTVGSVILINGANLSEVTNVNFAGTSASFTNTAPNQIHAVVPFGATNGPIQVIAPSGTNSSTTDFTVTFGVPFITDFSPSNGLAGSEVILTGIHFSGAANVTFNGVNAASFGVTSDSQISAFAPAGASTGPITVFGPAGTNQSTNAFYFTPRITEISPLKGPAATHLSITGSNFTDTVSVRFVATNDTRVDAPFSVVSDTRLDVIVPTNALTGAITIAAPGGVVVSTNSFSVLPRIDNITPPWAPIGADVVVHGYNFEDIASLKIGNLTAGYTYNSATQLTVRIPAGASTAPINIQTTPGDAISSTNDLIVTTTTDLGIIHTPNPVAIIGGQNFDFLISITNLGPSIATQVRMTHSLSTAFTINSATSTLGTCKIEGRVITCDIPVFTNHSSARVTVNARSLLLGGFSSEVHIDQREGDSTSANNFHSLVIPIIQESDRLISINPVASTNLIQLMWRASPANFKPQATTDLLSTNTVWETLTNDIFTITQNFLLFNVVTNDVNVLRRFYRLFKD